MEVGKVGILEVGKIGRLVGWNQTKLPNFLTSELPVRSAGKSVECEYISKDVFYELDIEYERIIKMLNSMEFSAEKFC